MKPFFAMFKRELAHHVTSPIAYVVLIIFSVLSGWFYVQGYLLPYSLYCQQYDMAQLQQNPMMGQMPAPNFTEMIVASLFSTSAGTTAISAIGTVLDTSNPVGLALDRKGGATALADPGIHLSQATATSRPVASARVNLLTYSEDFSNAAWTVAGGTVTNNAVTAPDGTLTGSTLNAVYGYMYQQVDVVQN